MIENPLLKQPVEPCSNCSLIEINDKIISDFPGTRHEGKHLLFATSLNWILSNTLKGEVNILGLMHIFLYQRNLSCMKQCWFLPFANAGLSKFYFFYTLVVSRLGDAFANSVCKWWDGWASLLTRKSLWQASNLQISSALPASSGCKTKDAQLMAHL